jgi:hypothetical protein
MILAQALVSFARPALTQLGRPLDGVAVVEADREREVDRAEIARVDDPVDAVEPLAQDDAPDERLG